MPWCGRRGNRKPHRDWRIESYQRDGGIPWRSLDAESARRIRVSDRWRTAGSDRREGVRSSATGDRNRRLGRIVTGKFRCRIARIRFSVRSSDCMCVRWRASFSDGSAANRRRSDDSAKSLILSALAAPGGDSQPRGERRATRIRLRLGCGDRACDVVIRDEKSAWRRGGRSARRLEGEGRPGLNRPRRRERRVAGMM